MNLEHISEDLIERLDRAVGEAIRTVDERETEQVTSALAFTAKRDKDGDLIVEYDLKHGSKRGGSWRPTRGPRLPFDEPEQSNGADGGGEVIECALVPMGADRSAMVPLPTRRRRRS